MQNRAPRPDRVEDDLNRLLGLSGNRHARLLQMQGQRFEAAHEYAPRRHGAPLGICAIDMLMARRSHGNARAWPGRMACAPLWRSPAAQNESLFAAYPIVAPRDAVATSDTSARDASSGTDAAGDTLRDMTSTIGNPAPPRFVKCTQVSLQPSRPDFARGLPGEGEARAHVSIAYQLRAGPWRSRTCDHDLGPLIERAREARNCLVASGDAEEGVLCEQRRCQRVQAAKAEPRVIRIQLDVHHLRETGQTCGQATSSADPCPGVHSDCLVRACWQGLGWAYRDDTWTCALGRSQHG